MDYWQGGKQTLFITRPPSTRWQGEQGERELEKKKKRKGAGDSKLSSSLSLSPFFTHAVDAGFTLRRACRMLLPQSSILGPAESKGFSGNIREMNRPTINSHHTPESVSESDPSVRHSRGVESSLLSMFHGNHATGRWRPFFTLFSTATPFIKRSYLGLNFHTKNSLDL